MPPKKQSREKLLIEIAKLNEPRKLLKTLVEGKNPDLRQKIITKKLVAIRNKIFIKKKNLSDIYNSQKKTKIKRYL